MKIKTATTFLRTLGLATLLIASFGCSGDETNAPTAEAVEKANVDRFKAIDADPNMSAADKEILKSKLGGVKGTSGPDAAARSGG